MLNESFLGWVAMLKILTKMVLHFTPNPFNVKFHPYRSDNFKNIIY